MGNRETLLEAATELVDGVGEAAVRVDPVDDIASVTKPSPYHFCGDRNDLIVAGQVERYRRSLLYGMERQRETTEACESHEQFIE
jgi:AcrR family transcriptional regulator